MIWEIVRFCFFGTVLFYAAINFGFDSPSNSQVDQLFWVDAIFNYNLRNSTQNNRVTNQTALSKVKENEDSKSIRIPLSTPSDSVKNSFGNKIDTSFLKKDTSLALKDTIKIDSLAIDSTARIKYFNYTRTDVPYVKFSLGNQSSFFAQPSPGILNRTVTIDSTGKFVEIRETTAGKESKILLRMPIDDYLKLSLAKNEQQMWGQLFNNYEYKGSKKELSQLIKDITNFEIPLPSVGVLSIFGKPKISLRIGGAVDIHAAWNNTTTQGITASNLGNTQNAPDFQQQVQINVDGTIGDKLNISADWNTQRTFEYQNQLKIKYTGYEDEIIQNIEAGNVSLETSPLVGGSEALFGIKANFKLGPLSLTTLASQKKGQIKTVQVNGGATSQNFSIRAYNYATNNYFLDTVYSSTIPSLNLFYNYYSKATPQIDATKRIVDIQVWKSQNGLIYDPSKERQAIAYINLHAQQATIVGTSPTYPDAFRSDSLNPPVPGQTEVGRFVLLTPDVDYTLHPETGYITFNTQIQDQDVIAVAYRVENLPGPQDDSFYGEFLNSAASDTSKKLVLKLVKPAYLKPSMTEAWQLLLKNIYPIGGVNIKQDGFVFNIKYEIPGADPVTDLPTPSGATVRLLNAFGLDNYDASGNPNPDNVFDWRPDITILPVQGEIIFPSLQPFGNNFPSSIPDSLKFQAVYDTIASGAQNDKLHDRWELTGKFSGEASSTYQLGFNVVENSVRVILNGRELTPGVDYTVDYNVGQLTIRNDAALVPGANLKITFEQNDLFQLASKTLVGARGLFNFSKKTKLGFSILNLNQQTLSDKVRIGEEPLSNTIMGVDFSTSADLPFLTNALDNVISTKEMSSLTLSGEYAYMKPNPNTKISNIPDDHGQSVAYVDDFEGAKVLIPVGVSYTGWKDLSAPDRIPSLAGLSYQQMMNYKAKSFWYSITPSDVLISAIWGNRKYAAAGQQQVPVMDFVFIPDSPGTYNYNPDTVKQNPKKSWGGMMKVLSSTANDLQAQNIQYIEFWLQVEPGTPASDSVYIDLGRISEDVIPNRILNTEDINHNGILAPGADVGIDGLNDAQEQATFHSTRPDPSGDDFALNTNLLNSNIMKWYNVNGTEGNAVLTDVGRIPDTEDLNGNGNLDLVNSYFRYAIPLDTNKNTNPYIAGGGDNAGWYLYRIPLKDTSLTVGQPSFSDVEFIRLFAAGVSDMIHLRFAEFNLVGNQWQNTILNDSTLSVSVVNVEDNLDYYSPPGVTRPVDPTQPTQTVYLNEQSLSLTLNDLPAGQSREAVKYLYRPLDVFNYKEMRLFIHGDDRPNSFTDNISDTSNGGYTSEVYLKFGTDTSNYYEYRQPVKPGWNDVDIIFSDLTALKQNLDTTTSVARVFLGQSGASYAVKGNPTLTSVKFLTIGIANRTNTTSKPRFVSGTVWVDELRVLGADNHPGSAYSFATTFKLADLFTVNFNINHTDPYFHPLSDQFGSRVDTKNWSLSTTIDVLKLLPFHMPGSNLSFNYSHTESVGKPLYKPGTDININSAAQQLQNAINDSSNTHKVITQNARQLISSTQTISVSDSWSTSGISLKIPSSFWLIRDTFNAMTFGFNYNKSFSRSPTVLSNLSWQWNANFNYGLNFSSDDYISLVKIPVIGTILGFFKDYRNLKIYYAPQNFSLNMTASRSRNTNVSRSTNNVFLQPIISRNFSTSRGFNMAWKLTDGGFLNLSANYSMNISSSLAYLETDANNNQRPESYIWKEILSHAFFGNDFMYQQNVSFNSSPKLPTIWNIDQYLSITAAYNASYQWGNNFSQRQAGRSAGFNSKSTVGVTLRLKSLMEPLFAEPNASNPVQTPNTANLQNEREKNIQEELQKNQLNGQNKNEIKNQAPVNPGIAAKDTTAIHDSLQTKNLNKMEILKKGLDAVKTVVRVLLFDYESIALNFSNSNSVSKSGILGTGTGFYNFWGISFKDNNGPSRTFMLGLSGTVGRRVSGVTLQDVSSQSNDLSFSTSKPLWEGAKIDLNWRVGWSMNKSTSLEADSTTGNIAIQSMTSSGTITRSFFTLPPVFFLSALKSGIKRVHELYDPNAANPSQSLSDAFTQGFETLPIFSRFSFLKNFADYIPRPNWSITWDGLEKIYPFKSFAQRVSFEHAYSSTYSEGWYISPDGTRITQSQRIDYGFTPLVGLNFTFAQLWNGNLTSSIKYSTHSTYDLGVSTTNITEAFSRDVGITAGYSKSGFELPIFGISLKNDIEFSFSYTNSQTSTIIYDMNNYTNSGTPQDGTNRISIEPRVKYTISSKVTIAIFYTRSSVKPVGASRIPPTTSNQAGLDVHISIQ
ncbi:MAG: T9SS outer membrane translocon Sov/SprA [Ignavibacteriaceae bacterium]